MHLKQHLNRARGFSLIEVLVSLLVISIGLLGIAKMQALALSNTNGGRLRALASIEAASLVSTIQAERNYWGTLTSNLTISIVGTPGSSASSTITSNDSIQSGAVVTCTAATGTTVGTCSGNVSCTSTASPCTAQKMAAYDLEMWAGRLQQVLGSDAVSITCTATTPPVSCEIIINWSEATVNANAAETTTMATPSYTIFVNP
jgi:type IV pilus assembly protein PilV